MIKHIFRLLAISLLASLTFSCIKQEDIDDLQSQIDIINNERIASLEDQVRNILKSISELESYRAGLEGYIKDLQAQDIVLKEAIEEVKASIKGSGDVLELEDRISQSEAAILALENRVLSVESTIASLQTLYSSLETKIANLKSYVEDELGKQKDWANATFCTLEQYYGVTDDITSINRSIALINSALSDMENSISGMKTSWSEEIEAKLSAAISSAKTELETSWTEDIVATSKALEASLKSWVNRQLEGYYTAAETDSKLESIRAELEGKLESQKVYLEGLISSLGATLTSQISSNTILIEGLGVELSSLKTYAQTNAANIAANAESISKNAQAILKNALDISSIGGNVSGTLEEELEKIRQSVADNKSLIETNELLISSNTLAISNLNSTFAECSESVKANASAIASNATAIANNASLIAANVSAIADNATAIAENTTAIAALRRDLADAKQKIKEDYEAAIAEAFRNVDTDITETINVNLTVINEHIDSEVSEINSKIASIETRISALEQQFAEIIDRVNNLESTIETINTSITTISDQISGINSTIEELKATDISVKSAIETLQIQNSNLQSALAEMNSIIEQIQQDGQSSVITSQLESLKSTVESQIASLNSEIEALKLYDSSLSDRITTLETYTAELESKISESESNTKAWAEATFTTLAEYNATCEELASVKATANAAKTAVETLDDKVDKILSEDIPAALSELRDDLRVEIEEKVNTLNKNLTEAISTARSEITTAYESAIATAVASSENSMRNWINEKLTAYYTAAETDAKIDIIKQTLENELVNHEEEIKSQIEALEALVAENNPADADTLAAMRSRISALQQKLAEVTKSNEESIASLRSDIIKVKQELTVDYQSAIETAITENNGLIDKKIAAAISNANSTIVSQISTINSELETLVGRVAALETQVADIKSDVSGLLSELNKIKGSLDEILSMIQSITVVPDNSDGSVNTSRSDSETVDFEIFPLSAAKALAETWSGAVSLRAVYTEPVTKSSHNFVELPVSNVTYANGVVTVTYNSTGLSEDFWNELVTVNTRLLISDGNNCVASQYYLLNPQMSSLEDDVTDKEFSSPANCYIVSKSGLYKFPAVKGNSDEFVGDVVSASVLWESFGTDEGIAPGSLISVVSYDDGNIIFETAAPFREGNAVIAAKDAYGNILWSWHIWLTDEPQGQEYNNNAGVMMDRNLGATSATPGDVGALGLLYQWGRKDPFLGSSSIISNTEPESTIIWPSAVVSDSSTGTIDYATSHPTTFIYDNERHEDWVYTGNSFRWMFTKTIYDPCPAGWRVPDGGTYGVWATALGTRSNWSTSSNWNSINRGMDFSLTDKVLGTSGPIWYPASGSRSSSSRGAFYGVGYYGHYWAVLTPGGDSGNSFSFDNGGYVNLQLADNRALAYSVRCLKE